MKLTATQLQHIDAMRRKAEGHLAQYRAWKDSNHENWAFARASNRLEEGVKAAFKAIINEWLDANNLAAHIRSELRVRRNYPKRGNYRIQLGATSIFNGKGGLDNKSRWLNKITVVRGPHKKMKLRSHKARTDASFLEPTATEFVALIQAIVDALDQ